MNLRKIALATALGAAIGIAGFATQPETGHAAYYYWTKTKNYSPAKPYHQKAQKTTAYLWSAHHQYRVHNMKNYPGHTWKVSKSVKMRGAIYYRVSTQYGAKTVSGYVWRGYVTAGAFAVGNDVISGGYANSSKGIYYSSIPFAATYENTPIKDYDPTKIAPIDTYRSISSATFQQYAPKLTDSQVATIRNFMSHWGTDYKYRIVDLSVLDSAGGSVKIPMVQAFEAPATNEDGVTSGGYWATGIPATTVLERAKHDLYQVPGSSNASNYVQVMGPKYLYPNDQSAILPDTSMSLFDGAYKDLGTVGDFTEIAVGTQVYYVKTADMFSRGFNQVQTVNGMNVSDIDAERLNKETPEAAALRVKGITEFRSLHGNYFTDYAYENGKWVAKYSGMIGFTATVNGHVDPFRVYFEVNDPAKSGDYRIYKKFELNKGDNSFKQFLLTPASQLPHGDALNYYGFAKYTQGLN
ncbi:hypothetical protein FC96_GL001499 [Secundilactobacillus kimchicus JCM 15530]|uniref:D-alanyl-D-alanine carboxypeptidase n=1 Tax=Secundilactobacillus kimchicus JCM 15530 TaxID=1302272 RepID=A0A0R1HNI2_9LACO|nr:hypothetical protein [Secundilactobacillus kimchicus]KRK48397.1 hypothetical protein FC96_GL001499 [Secundilactobacillus kimchicus JCM 15530]